MSDDQERRRMVRPPSGGTAAGRGMGQKIKTADKKSMSSQQWIKRQLADKWSEKARAEGWRSRAAFKLLEMDEQLRLIKPGSRVIDLGAAPGGWAQVCVQRGCTVVGVDLLPIDHLDGAIFFQMDLTDPATPPVLLDALGGAPDVVLSDMAANTTGHARTDQIRTGALAEAAADFALEHVAPGGTFVTKAFQGGLETELLTRLKQSFATVRHAKPPASRAESSEVYVVAQGRKPLA
jgi:23S rRNA (uridine2552-2'-O)-methyltransferase